MDLQRVHDLRRATVDDLRRVLYGPAEGPRPAEGHRYWDLRRADGLWRAHGLRGARRFHEMRVLGMSRGACCVPVLMSPRLLALPSCLIRPGGAGEAEGVGQELQPPLGPARTFIGISAWSCSEAALPYRLDGLTVPGGPKQLKLVGAFDLY